MKISSNLVLLVLIIVLSMKLINCTPDNKIRKTTDDHRKSSVSFDDMIWKDYNRIIGLTSTKYNIQDSVIKDIFIEYLRINQPIDYKLLTSKWKTKDTTATHNLFKPKETVSITITRLFEKYQIRKDSISSILMDFELWYNTCIKD